MKDRSKEREPALEQGKQPGKPDFPGRPDRPLPPGWDANKPRPNVHIATELFDRFPEADFANILLDEAYIDIGGVVGRRSPPMISDPREDKKNVRS